MKQALLLAVTGTLMTVPVFSEPARWVYEGLVTQAAPELAPDLQSGWVLAGSFLFDPLELEESIPMNEVRAGRLEGGISEGELTIDLYYRIHFEASQASAYAGFDYQENDPDEDGRDLIGWFLPMAGDLKTSGWRSTWLQVWLADPEGEMLRAAPPAIPPAGFQWETAWFRLMFVNESGEEAFAEGRLEIFSPESAVERGDPEAELSAIIADLGDKLIQRDALIEEMRSELAGLRDRLSGLRSMVDLLVEERTHLQSEVGSLQERLDSVGPGAEEELAELTAEKALLEQQITEMDEKNAALEDQLGQSEIRRRELMDRIALLETPQEEDPASVARGLDEPIIIESPMIVETVLPPPESAPLPVMEVTVPRAESPKSRRFGPRKFR